MPDILRVTTPLPGTESAGKVRNDMPHRQEQQIIQTVTDPKTVTQTNPQDVLADRQAEKFLPNFESNYETFLDLLRAYPNAMEEIRTLVFSKMGQVVSSGIEAGMAEELATFMEMLKMDEGELLEFVKEQLDGAVKFKGPFFDIIRTAMARSGSHELRQAVVEFLKSYDSATSTPHILREMVANLESMIQSMPKAVGEQLAELVQQLPDPETLPQGQTSQVLTVVRESILPFLGRYMSSAHDFGPVRDFVTMLVLNTVRFEAGSMESFQEAIEVLLAYDEIAAKLPDVDPQSLARALLATAQQPAELATQLAKIISKGMDGEAGVQNKTLFENIVRAILVNESVYMPLLHAMIPAEIAGTLFYSEVWVDPDAEEGYENEQYERAIKMLVKFDIKNVGCFDLVLLYKGSGLDIHLFSPAHLVPFEKQISGAISEIAERNELHVSSFAQQVAAEPVLISQVFPKLYERKNAINVVI